jgi:hypothetical protein
MARFHGGTGPRVTSDGRLRTPRDYSPQVSQHPGEVQRRPNEEQKMPITPAEHRAAFQENMSGTIVWLCVRLVQAYLATGGAFGGSGSKAASVTLSWTTLSFAATAARLAVQILPSGSIT